MSNTRATTGYASRTRAMPSVRLVLCATVILTLILARLESPTALLVWAVDGVTAVLMTTLAMFAGLAVLRLLRLHRLEHSWRLLLATGLGLGFTSLCVLGCGVFGYVGKDHRYVAPAILGVISFIGLCTFLTRNTAPPKRLSTRSSGRYRLLLLAVAPFAAIVLIVASTPPGFLWQEEGFGYDVLEYHLQLPKEYYTAGIISYLPHNVYANFPSAAEMLYLFGTLITGEAIESWSVAKTLNAIMGGLFVCGAWLAGREISPRAGVVVALLSASCGWTNYLSGIAYVENGMLMMGMLSVAALMRSRRVAWTAGKTRWLAASGLLAGLACGFKYTAMPMLGLPITAAAIVLSGPAAKDRIRAALLIGLFATLAFSPWLIKNAVLTGNPVFPLADPIFPSSLVDWGPDEAHHFRVAHQPSEDESSLGARLQLGWQRILADPQQRFGAILLAFALLSAVRSRRRLELAALTILGIQMAVWLLATHLYARFAVFMLIPILLLAGRGMITQRGLIGNCFVGLLLLGVSVNFLFSVQRYLQHFYPGGIANGRIRIEGATRAFTDGIAGAHKHVGYVNRKLPEGSRVLLVGDARPFYFEKPVDYCVVFNRNELAVVADTSPTIDGIVEYLQSKGYTHVLVNWSEIGRLRRSRYGFPDAISLVLFEQLSSAGLDLIEIFCYGDSDTPYAFLYRVPEARQTSTTPGVATSRSRATDRLMPTQVTIAHKLH